MNILEIRETSIADFSFIYNLHRQTMYSYVEINRNIVATNLWQANYMRLRLLRNIMMRCR
jgi:hypothetical protein